MLKKLELDEAKELAKIIVESQISVSESLAEVLSAIYGSLVKPEELEQIQQVKYYNKVFKRREGNRFVAKSKELSADSSELALQMVRQEPNRNRRSSI